MKRVVVGMSGGVDSSVSAYLLQQQGYEVIGLFMQNWDSALNNDLADPLLDQDLCQAGIDFNDAQSVCDTLGIPLYRVNFVQEYWDKVFTNFVNDYKKGLTPNPDVFCNKYIKFDAFMDYAFKNFDCDYIAMGHYAQIKEIDGNLYLARGLDANKDQTYFLEQVSKEQLKHVLFPIGHLEKSEVRKIAQEANLITASKKDSTGICFIGDRKFNDFLGNYIKSSQGNFVDIRTKTIIKPHNGLMFYTIGQRKGLGIGGNRRFLNTPWYVVAKDRNHNIVYVDQQEDQYYLKSNHCIVHDINYLGYETDKITSVKFRYRSDDVNVIKYQWLDDITLELWYEDSLAVTPGQACVFYEGEKCLGGGEIGLIDYNGEARGFIENE